MFTGKDPFIELFDLFRKHLSNDNYDAVNELVGSPEWLKLRFGKANRAAEVEVPAITYCMNRVRKILDNRQGSIAEACMIFGSNIWTHIGHKDKAALEEQFCEEVRKILDDLSNTGRSGPAASRWQQEIRYLDSNTDLRKRMEQIIEEYEGIRTRRDQHILKKKGQIEFLIEHGRYDEAGAYLDELVESYGTELENIKDLSSELNLLKLKIEERRRRTLLDGKSLYRRVQHLSSGTAHISLEELEELRADIREFVRFNPDMPEARRLEQEFQNEAKAFLVNKTLQTRETMGPDEAVEWFTRFVLASHFASGFSNLAEYPVLKAVFRDCFESNRSRINEKTSSLRFDEAIAELTRFDHATCSLYSADEPRRRAALRERIEKVRSTVHDIQTEKELLEALCIEVGAYEGSQLALLRTERSNRLAAQLAVINTPYHDLDPVALTAHIEKLERISQSDTGNIGRKAGERINALQGARLRLEASRARKELDLHAEQRCLQELLVLSPADAASGSRLDEVRREYQTQALALENGRQHLAEHKLTRAISTLSTVTDRKLGAEALPLLEEARSDAALYNSQALAILPEPVSTDPYPLSGITDAELAEMRDGLAQLAESFRDSPLISERLDEVKKERSIRNEIKTISELRKEYGADTAGLLDQAVVLESLENHGTHPLMSGELNAVATALHNTYLQKAGNRELYGARRLHAKMKRLPVENLDREYPDFAESDPLHISNLEQKLEDAVQQARFALMELEKMRLPEAAACIEKASALCTDLPQLTAAIAQQKDIATAREIMLGVDRNILSPESLSLSQLEFLSNELDRAGKLLPAAANLTLLGLKHDSLADYRSIITAQTGIEGRMLLQILNRGAYLVYLNEEPFFGNRKAAEDRKAIPLTAPMIKEKHARLSFRNDVPTIEAIDGEFMVNGKKSMSHALRTGDELKLGINFKCRVEAADRDALVLTPHVASQVGSSSQVKYVILINRSLRFAPDSSGHIKNPHLQHPFELVRSGRTLHLKSVDENCEITPGADIKLKETNVSFTFNSAVK
ncbi:hypothetical protein [Maridesulfovibrio sp. FT414]|uniref:hypothetical protein n=1 Tax=Maridesulfovibrio sp. FT414 TaxID=2979469 RepID=UPI003D806848